MHTLNKILVLVGCCAAVATPAHADENLFGYIRGAETLPKGSKEVYQWLTDRSNKGSGHYRAVDSKTEFEYGVTDHFQISGELNALSINTSGIQIGGYLPQDKKYFLRAQGIEFGLKYNFLSPAKDDFGLSMTTNFEYSWIDPHSGQRKREYEVESQVQLQKYFLEGQLVWATNAGFRVGYEKRRTIKGFDDSVEWSTSPEVELNTKFGTGLSYRFVPNWYIGAETVYETEFETEVGTERWSVFAGPSLHWAGKQWWMTFTAFKQLRGGGERYDAQDTTRLHLIEKTKNELRLKVGYNF